MLVDNLKKKDNIPGRVDGAGISLYHLLIRAGIPVLLTFSLLFLTFLIPAVDSTGDPFFNLASRFAVFAYWVTESGGKFGAPVVAALMLLLLVTRKGLSPRQRGIETLLVICIVGICGGGGAALNEFGVKATLKVPRPNIVWLAGKDGSGPLGMTARQFYESGDKNTREKILRKVLEANPSPVNLAPQIRAHWIEMTGYSFPSGHSFSAMFFASFFLAMGISFVRTRRVWWFYLLLPWALAVCYSRPILRVHTPADITIGGLEGLAVGLAACLVARLVQKKLVFNSTIIN